MAFDRGPITGLVPKGDNGIERVKHYKMKLGGTQIYVLGGIDICRNAYLLSTVRTIKVHILQVIKSKYKKYRTFVAGNASYIIFRSSLYRLSVVFIFAKYSKWYHTLPPHERLISAMKGAIVPIPLSLTRNCWSVYTN